MWNHKTKVRCLANYVAKQAQFYKTIYILCPHYTLALCWTLYYVFVPLVANWEKAVCIFRKLHFVPLTELNNGSARICQCTHHPFRTAYSGHCFSQCNQSDIVLQLSFSFFFFLDNQCESTGRPNVCCVAHLCCMID